MFSNYAMIGNIKSSILPLALWTENSPVHSITSILYLEKSNSIVTGSENGHIIIWSTKTSENQLLPIHYLISHRSKVVTFGLAGSRKHTDIDYFVSFSKDGELGLWEAANGRSIEFVSNASFDVQFVFSYESENIKQRLLFCCLKSAEILIINSMSLSEICTLICINSPNVFSSVTAFNISTKDDVIIASTESGLTSMWVLNFADVNNEPFFNPKFNADESLKVDLSDPIKIMHNPYHTNIILIISACKFMIYHAKNWDILCYQNCRRGDYFINGEFVSSTCVLMHCQTGKSLYYKLPPRSNFEDPLFGVASSNLCENIPKLLCQFVEPKELSMSRHKVTTKIFDHGFVLWKGFTDGSICRWDFVSNVSLIQPKIFSLSATWEKMKKKPSNLANMLEDSTISGPVTSLLYLPDLSLFVLGMHNGSIFITNFESSIGNVFKKTPENEIQFIKLTGHCGPVVSLLHPCSTMKLPSRLISCSNTKVKSCLQLLKLAHVLWSGGEDFTIRIWDIKTQQCLNIFQCHSSPVILLRLNHLSDSPSNICGFSQGFTAAMFNSVHDEDPDSGEIKKMVNICMNAFMVAISEDDGISIIAMMKRKLLLYSIEHDSPIKSLGWILDSGYLLLETMNETVYVWDLSSRSLDRIETGITAQALMENCTINTKIRSKGFRKVIYGSDMVGRHSLDNLTSYHCMPVTTSSNKCLKFQFIKTGSADRYTPVIIFDLTMLLNFLDESSHTATNFYGLLCELDNALLQGFRNSAMESNFDSLMVDVTAVNRDMDLKILLIKIILSRAHPQQPKCPLDSTIFKFLDTKADVVASSFGQVNSKTGCVSFNLIELFKEERSDMEPTIENILLQLSISNKITNPLIRGHLESCFSATGNCEFNESSMPRLHSASTSSYNFLDYYSSTKLSKLLLAYKKSLLELHVPILLKKTGKKNRFSDCPQHLSFYTLERLFNSLIFGILDVCDWISTSAYQILVKVISDLSFHELQNFLLVLRMILLPDLDHYTTESGRTFSVRIQSHLNRFSEQSFLASDWIWWYSPTGIKIDQDKRNLTKIQIKALVYLALIGTYLHSDDYIKSNDDSKLFSKIFSLDNFFLARTTCDFLLNLLTINTIPVKKTKCRLISLSMMCLSNGFTVWEPYLNSSTLICQLFEFTEENDDEEDDSLILSHLAKQSLRCIALTRPLVFVMACYREMLRLQNGNQNYVTMADTSTMRGSPGNSMQKMQSSPALMNQYDSETFKKQVNSSILKKNILFPILEELCETKAKSIEELLPEVVELYLNYHAKFSQREIDVQHLLYPVLKFSAVSIHAISGHVAVGSSNGSLVLFDYKIGKYFTNSAHKKAIKLTQFSNDAKHLASYSTDEGCIKIWQISHSGLFHIGSNSYHVKMAFTQEVPSVDQMIQTFRTNGNTDVLDSHVKGKKRKSLKKSASKSERGSYIMSSEPGLSLSWNTDNKTVSIVFNNCILRNFKL